jgi:superfamily II DNA/RNA helicase
LTDASVQLKPKPPSLEARLPPPGEPVDGDRLLELFLDYAEELGVELYPAQEEAILEVFSGHNVVLNTPTGSGKSLVALAVCFKALADNKFAFYTAPIKALVTEKFFELCAALGARNVGMMTGDASVNRDAPIVCCTAEILANVALREGSRAQADWVVMDEFHYYSDRDRGAAWQIPLLTLPQARFLLMSATLGKPEFFVGELTRRTSVPTALVRSSDRPVPLDWEYSETPLQETVQKLAAAGKSPIYIVHFSQRAASERAQDLMSLNFTTKEGKQLLKEELKGFRFDSPFGKELSRFLPHGIGVHHAGMLPKYRRLVERLAQRGVLHIICGTDTLGVGVNVPIRTVLFTQLCKYDGEHTTVLSVRDFQQIAGRAGRRGFDTLGSVVVQAPEHEIENKVLKQRAEGNPKKQKKLHLKRAPERGYKPWNDKTLVTLRDSEPEALVSRLNINHGMLLNVLSQKNGCHAARTLLRNCHEPPARKRQLLKQGMSLFGSLVSAQILSVRGHQVSVNTDLQEDFSLNHALALYAIEAIEALDPEHDNYALSLLSVIEAIMESPATILHAQVARLKTLKMNELKAQGVEYEQRIEELDKIEHPKPESVFIYETFNLFAKKHPWVTGHDIAPKSIARDMHEQVLSFNDYIKEYGLARAEGVLLRYLTDVYRALKQTVPEKCKTEDVLDLEEWLGAEVRQVDASLIDEWERLEAVAQGDEPRAVQAAPPPPPDITRNARAFEIMIKNATFRLVRAMAGHDDERFLQILEELAPTDGAPVIAATGETLTPALIELLLAPYWAEHATLSVDADARSAARVAIERGVRAHIPQGVSGEIWYVRQTLSDPEENHDQALHFAVDLAASRRDDRLVMTWLGLQQGTEEPGGLAIER